MSYPFLPPRPLIPWSIFLDGMWLPWPYWDLGIHRLLFRPCLLFPCCFDPFPQSVRSGGGGPQACCRGRGLPLHLVCALGQSVAVRRLPPPLPKLTGLTAGRVSGALAAPIDLSIKLFYWGYRAPTLVPFRRCTRGVWQPLIKAPLD